MTGQYIVTTDKTWAETQRDLEVTMRRWGVKEWETNYPPGARSSLPGQTEKSRTVKLTYSKDGKPVTISMGKQSRAVDNLRVLWLAVEAMRLNEMRGVADVVKSAYVQLAAPEVQRDPYEVLGIRRNAPLAVAEAAYRALARSLHSDTGGTDEEMKQLNRAIEQIRAENKK